MNSLCIVIHEYADKEHSLLYDVLCKVRALSMELKEAEYTLNVVQRQMKSARERATAQVAELRAAREEKIRISRDLQVLYNHLYQLILLL